MGFAEVYGMPLRVGRYEPGASRVDREALINAVRSLGSDAAGTVQKSTEIEFKKPGKVLPKTAPKSKPLFWDLIC